MLEFVSGESPAPGPTFEHLQWDSILLMPAGSGRSAHLAKLVFRELSPLGSGYPCGVDG